MKRFIERHADDVLILAGAGCVVYGAALRWGLDGALFMGGGLLIAAGIAVGMGGRKR
jgi:hypothetical protein